MQHIAEQQGFSFLAMLHWYGRVYEQSDACCPVRLVMHGSLARHGRATVAYTTKRMKAYRPMLGQALGLKCQDVCFVLFISEGNVVERNRWLRPADLRVRSN